MPDPAIAPEPLRLVLFGPPGAGKSSLLGAFAQAAEVQPHLLDGRIADASPDLAALRRQTYDRGPPPAVTAVVPYSLRYEPAGAAPRRDAVLLDCDGRAAEALVRDPHAAAPLSHEMVQADAVVLAVDASAAPEELDALFGEFDAFLRRLERQRGDRTEVGGLPVFLVLTKCDRLARPGEIAADWMEHIEERKREVADRFHDFLAARDAAKAQPAFGRIDLHVWATAVRRPALAGAVAGPTDPYGVAELFRQTLRQADSYRTRRERSAHRLVQLTAVMGGALALLLAAATSMVFADVTRPPSDDLRARVEYLRRGDPSDPATRLQGSPERLQTDLDVWTGVRAAAGFGDLPPDLRTYVEGRIAELDAYIPWLEKLEEETRPRDAVTEEELRLVQADLAGLAPPRPDWGATDAGRLWADLSAEAKALLVAIDGLVRWYTTAYDRADVLWAFSGYDAGGVPDWNGWAGAARRLLDPVAAEPAAADATDVALLWAAGARGAGSPGEGCPWVGLTLDPGYVRRYFVPGVDPPMTQADLQEFGSVASARERQREARARVSRLLDVGAALGLTTDLSGKPPLLILPPQAPDLEGAASLFRRLQEAYPDYRQAFMAGSPLPTAVAGAVRATAARNYRRLLPPAQEQVLQELRRAPSGDADRPDTETRERWAAVREWLKDPKELGRGPDDPAGPDAWRGLAYALARLAAPDAPEPVQALAAFLDTPSFTIHIRDCTLLLPGGLDVEPAPGRPIEVHFTPRVLGWGWAPAMLSLRPVGGPERVGTQNVVRYAFTADDPDRKLTFTPGDGLYAELPLVGGKTLRWDHSRSRLYQFESLRTDPVVLNPDRPGERTAATGAQLQMQPDGGAPNVPDLMPQVDLK